MNMNKTIGAVCLAAGLALLAWGYHVSRSINSEFKNAFTGAPTDKAVYLYIGGGLLCAYGLFALVRKSKV